MVHEHVPVLRLFAGTINGAAGLALIIGGIFHKDLAFIAAGIAIIGPMTGFFIGEANGRRKNGEV